jgi:aminopeptidase N
MALRTEVGDDTFFAILRGWHDRKRGGNATAHAKQVSGKQLDSLFQTWIHNPTRSPTSPNGTTGSVAPTRNPSPPWKISTDT